ncbi:MAG: glutamine synthetase III [Simkaniaceae bacterium]|nr:glutamine synthetase III [Simkaniaceae bacterium]
MQEESRRARYASHLFGPETAKEYLPDQAYRAFCAATEEQRPLEPIVTDTIASGIRQWAMSKGARYFSHRFHPLRSAPADKYSSLFTLDPSDNPIPLFTKESLLRGEPDASSFPSGNLRRTSEACGYTAWDSTTPPFIRDREGDPVLYIPSVFYSYEGDALDWKIPLLRSVDLLSSQVCRLGKLLGMETGDKKARIRVGFEQEYFLIDREHYLKRPDLVATGRTLFGRFPEGHRSLSDHYFGPIGDRVRAFMKELEETLWKLGILVNAKHGEVCTSQYELSVMHRDVHLAAEHNALLIDLLHETANKHGLACLMHEKPYAGANGSGKHNNWSVTGPDGKNWFTFEKEPEEVLRFKAMVCAVIKGVDKHAELLRLAFASHGNDYRLGANEAPPPLLAVSPGSFVGDMIAKTEKDPDYVPDLSGRKLLAGLPHISPEYRGITDRNRTAPLAFTGNKWEFRALGASTNLADANAIFNTAIADALDNMCENAESAIRKGATPSVALKKVLMQTVATHKRVIYGGDAYAEAWFREAEARGLPHLATTGAVLETMGHIERANHPLRKHAILTDKEWDAHLLIRKEEYTSAVTGEAETVLMIARTLIIPAGVRYLRELRKSDVFAELGETLSSLLREILVASDALEKNLASRSIGKIPNDIRVLREPADRLEELLPKDLWPLPSYTDMVLGCAVG